MAPVTKCTLFVKSEGNDEMKGSSGCTFCREIMADYEALTALIDVAGLKKEGKVRNNYKIGLVIVQVRLVLLMG